MTPYQLEDAYHSGELPLANDDDTPPPSDDASSGGAAGGAAIRVTATVGNAGAASSAPLARVVGRASTLPMNNLYVLYRLILQKFSKYYT